MQASGKTIGILSAVVIGGLGLWYMTKDDDETVADTTTTPMVTPTAGDDPDAVTCNEGDSLSGCPADKSHCEGGECMEATSKFATHTGSLYPDYGGSDLLKPEARKSIKGSEMCAKACLDDPDCIADSLIGRNATMLIILKLRERTPLTRALILVIIGQDHKAQTRVFLQRLPLGQHTKGVILHSTQNHIIP